MNRTILEKLKSRKLWAAIVGVIVGLAAAFGIGEGEYTEIAGIVTSAVSVVAYIFAEAKVDAANAGASAQQSDETNREKSETAGE